MTGSDQFNEYKFYEIRSLESLRMQKGVRKRTLACEEESHFHCFFWVDQLDQIHQIQILTEEKVLAWHYRSGIKTGYTNRIKPENFNNGDTPAKGTAKGSRTIHDIHDDKIVQKVMALFSSGTFPGSLGTALLECFQLSKGHSSEEQQKRLRAKKISDGFHPYVKMLPCAIFSLIGAADGHIDEKEWAILQCYASDDFPLKSTLLKLVFTQVRNEIEYFNDCKVGFEKTSADKTLQLIRRYMAMISQSLTKQAFMDLKKDLFLMALNTARASGGMLGMYKISKEEKEQLAKLAELFQLTDTFQKMLSKGE